MTALPARRRAIALMIAAMALFAAMDAINKTLTQGYSIPQIMAIRFVLFVAIACAVARRGPCCSRRTIPMPKAGTYWRR